MNLQRHQDLCGSKYLRNAIGISSLEEAAYFAEMEIIINTLAYRRCAYKMALFLFKQKEVTSS